MQIQNIMQSSKFDPIVDKSMTHHSHVHLLSLSSLIHRVGKTFEAFTLAGYAPPPSIRGLLETISKDDEGLPSPQVLKATYSAMQQLLPGEKQDAASLAMGQTYEQLDRDEAGRLGQRGTEDAESALLESTSS